MQRSPYPARNMSRDTVDLMAAVVGAGTSAPTVAPATTLKAEDNFAASASRTSEGLYVITLKDKFGHILDVKPSIMRASGALKHVNLVSFSDANGTITVQVSLANGGGVDDIETTDTLFLRILAKESP